MAFSQFEEHTLVHLGFVFATSGTNQGVLAQSPSQPIPFRIDALTFTNFDVADHSIMVSEDVDGLPLAVVSVPAGAGNGTIPPVYLAAVLADMNADGLIIQNGAYGAQVVIDAVPTTGPVAVAGWGGYF